MKILNLDNWCKEAEDILSEVAEVEKWDKEYIPYWHQEYGGIITDLSRLDTNNLFPNLKFIASCTTGLDHIDLDYCKAKGIKVISLQGDPILQDVHATAEHTWALILSLIRKVPFAFDDVKQGNWEREKWQGTELRGKTLGVIGYGRVGEQVADIGRAFGMRVIYNDSKNGLFVEARNQYYSLNELLNDSDIVTVHVPLTEETKGMFGIEQFKLMKPTAYFINTSRALIVEPQALYNALDGQIRGAAIDVMEGYPNKFWDYLIEHAKERDNLIITPHIGGNTAESREKTQIYIANKIKEYIQNEM